MLSSSSGATGGKRSSARAAERALRATLTIIGSSAALSRDFFRTPLGEMSGSAILANALRGFEAAGPMRGLPPILEIPLIGISVVAIVAFFLLLMVALGLLGVLWQNLLQRTREVGLRRAAGASRSAVHRQVLFEQVILTSFGVLLGVIVVVQVPILELVGFIRPQVFAGGLLFAMAAIYLLSTFCALYPGFLASRVQPAEALRYE